MLVNTGNGSRNRLLMSRALTLDGLWRARCVMATRAYSVFRVRESNAAFSVVALKLRRHRARIRQAALLQCRIGFQHGA